jgi:hypothetical protein
MTSVAPEFGSPTADEATDVDPDNRVFQPVAAKGPALIVLGLAVFIVVVGIIGSISFSGSSPTFKVGSLTIPDGTVVHLTPATTAMKSVISAGDPPADIIGNLAVPTGARVTRSIDTDQGVTQYDRTVAFATGLSSDQVTAVYQALLPRLGWKIIHVGPTLGTSSVPGTEILATKGSGDSFYWEVGAVVSPTTSAGVTPFSLEVYEQPDNN